MIEALLQEHGTPSQRERFAAGRLPDEELRNLARAIIFKPLDEFPRYKRLEEHDLFHNTAPCHDATVGHVVDDHYRGPMTDDQWERWKVFQERFLAIRRESHDLVDESTLILRRHTVFCGLCKAKRSKLSVLVRVDAGTLNLSREYAL